MDLKEFTKETLIQIVQGVEEANSVLAEKHAHVTSHAIKNSSGGISIDHNYINAVEVNFRSCLKMDKNELYGRPKKLYK